MSGLINGGGGGAYERGGLLIGGETISYQREVDEGKLTAVASF